MASCGGASELGYWRLGLVGPGFSGGGPRQLHRLRQCLLQYEPAGGAGGAAELDGFGGILLLHGIPQRDVAELGHHRYDLRQQPERLGRPDLLVFRAGHEFERGTTNSNTISVSVPANVCGSPPGNFTVSGNAYCNTSTPVGPAVLLSWTASAGAASYTVFRNGTSLSSGINGTTFDNNANVVAGQTYSYFVRATNARRDDQLEHHLGFRSGECLRLAARATVRFPATPTATPVRRRGPAVLLSWTASTGVSSYTVFHQWEFPCFPGLTARPSTTMPTWWRARVIRISCGPSTPTAPPIRIPSRWRCRAASVPPRQRVTCFPPPIRARARIRASRRRPLPAVPPGGMSPARSSN